MTGDLWQTYHRHPLSHVVHTIGGVSPWLDDDHTVSWQVKSADFSLHFFVCQTGIFDCFHVIGVNVRMFSLHVLLPGNLVLVEIDDKLEELIPRLGTRNGNLDSSIPRWHMTQGLLLLLLLQIRDHLLLGRLKQCDHAEVGVLAAKVRANDLRGLQGCRSVKIRGGLCGQTQRTLDISSGVRGSKGWCAAAIATA